MSDVKTKAPATDPSTVKKPVPRINLDRFEGLTELPEVPEVVTEAQKSLSEFDAHRITKEKEVPPTPPAITIGGSAVAAPGNITPVTAEGKGGKTAFTSVIKAGAISKTGDYDGFPDMKISPNAEGKAVIVIDTEQSAADQQYNLIKALERCGFTETPPYYLEYNIRSLESNTYQQLTADIVEAANREFGGIHMIIIDGGADYIPSVNEEESANSIVAFFIRLAVEYNCPVILVIHLNENAGRNGDTMPRGHLGRQAVRKGYCQLNITKEGDVSTLQALRARKANAADTPLVCYQYSKEKGYHVSVDAEAIAANKQAEKESAGHKKAETVAKVVFAPPTALLWKEAINAIMKQTKKSESTARRALKDMEGWGIVKKHDDEHYRLSL